MPQITFNIPSRAVTALARNFGVDLVLATVKAEIVKVLRRWVRDSEHNAFVSTVEADFDSTFTEPTID